MAPGIYAVAIWHGHSVESTKLLCKGTLTPSN